MKRQLLQLRGAISTETAEENLRRHYRDNARVAEGQAWLDEVVRSLAPEQGLALLLLDLDRSMIVRQRGIDAKVHVVAQLRDLVNNTISPDDHLIDSGSRDEMFVALPKTGTQAALTLAEKLRATVEQNTFTLPDTETDPVHLTVSIGISMAPADGRTAFDLMWSASAALQEAKRSRNLVAVYRHDPPLSRVCRLYDHQMHRLTEKARQMDRTQESVIREAVAALFAKHGGEWYWGVEHWDLYQYLTNYDLDT